MIDELRTFMTVSTVGSIQAAIRQLPLTQSAVTKQIQRLEQELHCTLLDRSVKPPRLTREGEERAHEAGASLMTSRSLRQALIRGPSRPAWCASASLTLHWIGEAVRPLRAPFWR